MDKKTFKAWAALIAWGVAVYILLTYLSSILAFLKMLLNLIFPLILGGVLAFILNVPMHGVEERMRKWQTKRGRKVRLKLNTAISAAFTILIAVGVLAMIIGVIIPQIVESAVSIYELFMAKYPTLLVMLEEKGFDTEPIRTWIQSMDFVQLASQFKESFWQILQTTFNAASSTVQYLFSFFMGIIFSIYILVNKRALDRQSRKVVYAYLKKEWAERVLELAALCYRTFSKFISGQCLEAIFLGCIFFLVMNLLQLPYASVISVMIIFMALIPYVGSFISLISGALLILLVSPMKALIYVVIFLVIQQVEGQLIYPRVVGSSVGLPPIWTLAAVLVGGAFFGPIGMVFFIPLTSVFYTLLRRNMNARLQKKEACGELTEEAVAEEAEEGDVIDEG
jgi:predicted PurR-regulated permease PerM